MKNRNRPTVVENKLWVQFSSVTQSCLTLCDLLDCSTPTSLSIANPGVYSNSCPLSRCHPTISSSVIPFSSCLQSFPASGSFPMSRLFASGGQNIGASASASVLSLNIQDWFPLGLTGLISLLFKGLSRVFPNTTVRKHQFFGTQPSLWSNAYITHDYWKKHSFDCTDLWGQSDVSAVFGSIDISKIKGMNFKNVFSSFKNILPYFIYLFLFFTFWPHGM